MTTLLMRLQGIQAWGSESRLTYQRTTDDLPTKSGVLGLVACALGRERDESIDDLATLRFGVRVDVPGRQWLDFHTIQDAPRARGGTKPRHITRRYYLDPNATFLAGLEGDRWLLREIKAALEKPAWIVSLGRRACLPMAPISLSDGLYDQSLEAALRSYPWLGTGEPPRKVSMEIPGKGDHWRQDQPLGDRQFAQRRVKTVSIPVPVPEGK